MLTYSIRLSIFIEDIKSNTITLLWVNIAYDSGLCYLLCCRWINETILDINLKVNYISYSGIATASS